MGGNVKISLCYDLNDKMTSGEREKMVCTTHFTILNTKTIGVIHIYIFVSFQLLFDLRVQLTLLAGLYMINSRRDATLLSLVRNIYTYVGHFNGEIQYKNSNDDKQLMFTTADTSQ